MKPNNKITLTTIAELAQTSIASVSRVIHTPHLTSNRIKHRVYEAIKTLEYSPDARLKKEFNSEIKSKTLLIIDNQYQGFSSLNLGIQSEAAKKGYKLLYLRFYFFNQDEIQEIISYTINHQVDGILMINDSVYSDKLLNVAQALPPIVLVNQFQLKLPSLYFDHVSMAFNAIQYLIKNGHRQILLLLTKENSNANQQIENGYRQAYKRANLTIEREHIIYDCHDSTILEKQLKYQLHQKQDPVTAILCADKLCLSYQDIQHKKHDDESIQESLIDEVIYLLEEMNLNVPNDISLVYFSHLKVKSIHSKLNMTSYFYKPLFKMGTQSVSLLLDVIDHPHSKHHSILLESDFVERFSVKKLGQY